jgi:hypothetical protein
MNQHDPLHHMAFKNLSSLTSQEALYYCLRIWDRESMEETEENELEFAFADFLGHP